MKPIAERDIRRSFVNCSQGEASRVRLPGDLADVPWPELDFLGWRDPGAPERAYLIAERDGELIGITMRAATGRPRNFAARSMCSLCLTTHTAGGVTLMTARRTGAAGQKGDSVGQYLCTDLACSLYLRGRIVSAAADEFGESLSPGDKIARARVNLDFFLDKVTQ